MSKSVNLTVRVDPGIRAAAEAAAEVMETTVSSVVRTALRGLIAQAASKKHRARYDVVQEGVRRAVEEHDMVTEGKALLESKKGQAAVQWPRKVSRAKRKAARNAR